MTRRARIAAMLLAVACVMSGCSDFDRARMSSWFGGPEAKFDLAERLAEGRGTEADPGAAVALYREAAEEGHALAQLRLADALASGRGVEADLEAARGWYQKAGEAGQVRALLALARDAEARAAPLAEVERWYRRAAAEGVPEAQFWLGARHDAKVQIAEAVAWYRKAAAHGHAESQFRVAELFATGATDVIDDETARAWLSAAAEGGHPAAGRYLAASYLASGEEEKALDWYQRAAEAGDLEAQYQLGELYAVGRGTERDEEQSVAWIRRAAEQGYAKAENRLGEMYRDHVLVAPEDEEAYEKAQSAILNGHLIQQREIDRILQSGRAQREAVRWWRSAAARGYAPSMTNLAHAHARGQGAEADPAEARSWMQRAARAGDHAAMLALGHDAVAQGDAAAARAWFVKAAEGGSVEAQLLLGAADQRGELGVHDPVQAARWYRMASDAGSLEGQVSLALFHLEGVGVKQDFELARRMLAPAAEAGNHQAQVSLGVLYTKGGGPVAPDYAKAFALFRSAAEAGHPLGRSWLGLAYHTGRGVEKDPIAAYMWFLLSGADQAKPWVEGLGKSLHGWQVDEARRLAAEWKAAHPSEES